METFAKAIEGQIVTRYERNAGHCPDCGGQFIIKKLEPRYDNRGKVWAYILHKKCPNTRWYHLGGVWGKCWPNYSSYEVL